VVLFEGQEVALVKPTTFMNSSGVAAKEALTRFGAAPEDLLVVVDDTQLPLGRIRIRRQGSDGGHNGLLSIIEVLGTSAFPRLRLGIGAPPEGLIDFVLGGFEPHEREAVAEMVGRARDALSVILREGLEKAMNDFNKEVRSP
jgi:PTH1 family peptidyl-tRNA hydrolase